MPIAESIDDDGLVDAFKAGDGSALEVLFRRYRRQVFSWLLQMADDRADAEDLYQEAWLRIVRNVSSYESGGFRCWMWRIVRNCLIDHARKMRPLLALDEPLSDEADAETVVSALADPAFVDVLERMADEERRVKVRAAIGRLSPPLREVVLLRIDGELAFAEIAEMLGLKLGTVLARMHHAVKALRKDLVRTKEGGMGR